MAQAAWLPPLQTSANPERRSEYVDNTAHSSVASRWDLADILNPSSSATTTISDKKLSMDFASAATSPTSSQHPLFHQDLDQNFNIDHPQSSSSHHTMQPLDPLDTSDHSNYDIFNTNSSNSFSSHRIYSHPPPFADPVSPFNASAPGSNPYDVMNGMSSAYSSGKVSPLTPSDPVGGLHHPSFPPGKDFNPSHQYPDLISGRRMSGVSNGSFPSDFHDDYPMSVSNGLPFPPPSLSHYQDRRFHQDQPSVPSHLPPDHNGDVLRGVAPHATHDFRDNGFNDDIPQYMSSNPHPVVPLRMPAVDETLARMRIQGHSVMGASNDLQTFIRPFLDQYVRTPNRLAFGERTVIVMSSKVAQKSYGTEKRFLCPPPTAIMIGNSWWTDIVRRGEDPKLCPPRVTVSISGEPVPQEGSVEWTGSSGKSFDVSDPPTGTTYIGRCVGKQLFISDVDEKKKKVEALVKITAPASDDEPERVIGTFPSRPIKVISKPSKKRQSAKNLELCINHGSTISLFHRLRSQTVSTKYLCVSGSGSSFKGSDGAPLMGLDQRSRSTTPSFIARTASWDPFVMYIVDVNKPAGGIDAPPPPPPQPDYPSPPPNAIAFTNNGTQIPIYYNQTVVLQCLTSGVVSPVLIIRKVDHQTTVVGGGLQEGAKGVADHYCAPGEVCGDPVSQLHKIAFEVYDATKGMPELGTPGQTGTFLSCMGEKVNTYRPIEGRQWKSSSGSNSPPLPASPIASTPMSSGGSEYFGHNSVDSAPASPSSSSADFLSNDGGRVKKKRSTSSAGGIPKAVPKGRRRPSSAGSATSGRRGSGSDAGASSGSLWEVDIGETSVWTIVGTDQIRYNFYVPPVLFDNQHAPHTGSFPIPSKPVTPFPGVVKYLPPDRASEAPKSNCASSRAVLAKPNPHASKMLTVYGENFSKTDPVSVFFGSEPSPYVEVRCTEVLGCLPPENQIAKRRPLVLVRSDGVVFPSNVMYP